jgi:hypothetical protein
MIVRCTLTDAIIGQQNKKGLILLLFVLLSETTIWTQTLFSIMTALAGSYKQFSLDDVDQKLILRSPKVVYPYRAEHCTN